MIPYHYVQNAWYVAEFSDEFKTRELEGHRICDKPVVTWRDDDGKFAAFDNRCLLNRMPLSERRIMPNGTIECVCHGLCCDSAGDCVLVASHPAGNMPPRLKLKPSPVIGQVGLDVSAAKRVAAMFPEVVAQDLWAL